jgi:AbrB family looped-hinge helix DNA binding protein
MSITSRGQVTIPARIREKAGLRPNTEVDVVFDGQDVRIVKVWPKLSKARVQEGLRRLRGSATVKTSTDEIMKLTRGR